MLSTGVDLRRHHHQNKQQQNNKKEVYGCPNLTNVGLYDEAQVRRVIQCNVEYTTG